MICNVNLSIKRASMPDAESNNAKYQKILFVFMVGGFLGFLVFVGILICICRDIRRCLFNLFGLCKERITSNGADIQNQSEQNQVMGSSALSAPVMDSINPSAPKLDPMDLPPSYEEAVKIVKLTDTINQSFDPRLSGLRNKSRDRKTIQ